MHVWSTTWGSSVISNAENAFVNASGLLSQPNCACADGIPDNTTKHTPAAATNDRTRGDNDIFFFMIRLFCGNKVWKWMWSGTRMNHSSDIVVPLIDRYKSFNVSSNVSCFGIFPFCNFGTSGLLEIIVVHIRNHSDQWCHGVLCTVINFQKWLQFSVREILIWS